MTQLETEAHFLPEKESGVMMGIASVVFREKGGGYKIVPSGVDFTVKGVVVASLTREQVGRSTLTCNEEIAKKFKRTEGFKETRLIFLGLRPKK
jgi:hypothetical protein